MENQTEEQKDHFSPDRNHWCIVKYSKNQPPPIYYQGYFGKWQGGELLPAFGLDFNEALKLHSKIAAETLLHKLTRHAPETMEGAKVEDHKWM